MAEIDYQEYCTCEFGPLGTGRMDSNKCPIHDMTRDELISWGVYGWHEFARMNELLTRAAHYISQFDAPGAELLENDIAAACVE